MAIQFNSVSTQTEPLTADQVFMVYATKVKTGEILYAQARARAHEGAISLVFQTATKPFAEMSNWLSKSSLNKDETAAENHRAIGSCCIILGRPGSEFLGDTIRMENDSVERVAISLRLPVETRPETDDVGMSIPHIIISLCKATFPRIKSEEFNFNIHIGGSRYRADKNFFSDIHSGHVATYCKKVS